jgi:hypothetical protein
MNHHPAYFLVSYLTAKWIFKSIHPNSHKSTIFSRCILLKFTLHSHTNESFQTSLLTTFCLAKFPIYGIFKMALDVDTSSLSGGFGGESDKSYTVTVSMTIDMKLTELLTAKHISLFFLVSLGVELRRELRQQ